GPPTHRARGFEQRPGAEGNVKELLLMGGALDVPGNVQEPGHDGTAEWNIYWDPQAAKRVFDSAIPITMFALDATNHVPVTPEFRRAFGLQYGHSFSAAAGSLWAMTTGWAEAAG